MKNLTHPPSPAARFSAKQAAFFFVFALSFLFLQSAFCQHLHTSCPAEHWELHDHPGSAPQPGGAEKFMLSIFSGTVEYPNGTIQYSRMIIYDPVTFAVEASANVCLGNAPFSIPVDPGIYNVYYRPYQVGALPYEVKNVNLTSNLDTTLVLTSYTTPTYFDELSWSKVAIFADNNETVNIVANTNGAYTIDEIFMFNESNFINPAVGYLQGKIILKDDGLGADLVAGDGNFTSVPIKWDPATGYSRSGNLSSAVLTYFQVSDVVNGDKDYRYAGTTTRLGIVNPSATTYQPLISAGGNVYVNDYLINIVRPPGYDHEGDAEAVYGIYPDSFDFINIFHTNYQVGTSVTNFHFNVQNQVQGIAQTIFDNTAQYGSDGKLQGINVFPALSHIPPTNHEVLHQWSLFMQTLFNSNPFGGHNGYTTIDGVHGGIIPPFTINSSTSVSFDQAITFGYASDQKAFANFELYLMGAVDTNVIQDKLYVIYDPVYQGGNTYTVSNLDTITPQLIVSTYGYRSPAPSVADTDFKTAHVVISDAPLTNAAVAFYSYLAKAWGNQISEPLYMSFQEAALNNATMTTLLPLGCTALSSPANGATNVPVTTSLSWPAAFSYPTGYKVRAGTTPGGSDILNNVNVGNVTNYDPPGDLPSNTTIYVRIIPFNASGDTGGCLETSFTTETIAPPACTSLSNPANGATNVAITASLNWTAATGNPSGYRLDVGTTPGGTQILNNFDVGNVTSYNPPGDFPYSTIIYVKIKPYNGAGSGTGCPESSFTTAACAVSTFYQDSDGDNYGNLAATTQACSAPSGYVANSTDCNDANAAINPGATEICNGVDDDCDTQVDEGVLSTFYADSDGDTYGNLAVTTQACAAPSGYVVNSTDCNDANAAVHPSATEICNGIDDDCDTEVDEGTLLTFYQDSDGDTYGNLSATTQACSAPSGYVANSTDCNDGNAAINPGATEICNGVDDDCDGTTDEGCGNAMCGMYTVGGASPDFTTLQEAADSLVAKGIDCPVTIKIRNGTYTSGANLTAVSGTNAMNTITFESESGNPADVMINDFHCFYLDNCDYVRLKNLRFNSNVGYAVRIEGGSANISVTGNQFSGTNGTGIFSFGQGCPNLLVQNNEFVSMTIAIQLQDGNGATGVQIIGNTISNVHDFGILLDRHNSVTVRNNLISAPAPTVSYFAGIAVNFDYGAATEVSGNVVSPVAGTAFRAEYNFNLLIFNNFFHGTATSGSVVNLSSIFSGSNLFAFNSVFTDASATTAFVGNLPGLTLKNNVFSSVNGKALNLLVQPVSSNYNDLYTDSATLGTYLGTDCSDLAAWQTASSGDANSISAEALFNDGDPHSTQALLDGAGTPVSGVLVDIDGQARHASTPDIGADEFSCGNTFYLDTDSDTYGDAASAVVDCYPPPGYVSNSTDCNDANAAIHPGAPEICNNIDDDCSGAPESAMTTWTGLSDGVNWSSGGNWSDGFVPLPCQDVIIPAAGNVTVPAGFTAMGRTLGVATGGVLTTEPSGQVDIHN